MAAGSKGWETRSADSPYLTPSLSVSIAPPTTFGPRFGPMLLTLLMVGAMACGGADDGPAVDEAVSGATTERPVEAAAEPLEIDGYRPPDGLGSDWDTVSGTVVIDGSSTVFPISEAIARELQIEAPGIEVRLGVSGTGGGFEKFCRGETAISSASRPIKQREREECARRGVEMVELPIAFDGLSVVVHPDNYWADCMTLGELRRLWEPAAEGTIARWSQLRDGWPDTPVTLYGPGRDSGTFDYFTKSIVGREQASRNDFVGSEDDYLIAQDVASDPSGLGFFGAAYYQEYRDLLTVVEVDPGSGCVAPTAEAIAEGSYRPLSRPIFLYVSLAALDQRAVEVFVTYYLANAGRAAQRVGYVPLSAPTYELAGERLAQRVTGSVFEGGSEVGVSIDQLLRLARATAEATHPVEPRP